MPAPSRPTLNSVAAEAGVSRQTVSNVIHRPELVNQPTRDRVSEAIDRLGYRPNLAARRMRTTRSQALAVRIGSSLDGINAVVLDRFVHALCRVAEQDGYHLVVFTAADDADEIRAYQHLDHTLGIDGYVLVGTHVEDQRVAWLAEHQRPFVAFGRPWSEQVDHHWVDVDGAAGTRAATEHLLDAGHEHIAFLGWSDSLGTGDDREAGWREAIAARRTTGRGRRRRDAGLVVLRGEDTVADGRAMAVALDDHPEVTAAVCVSDSLAIGVHAARPGFPVIGFDDTPTARMLGIRSVAQPYERAAQECYAALVHQLAPGSPEGTTHRLLAPTLRTDPEG